MGGAQMGVYEDNFGFWDIDGPEERAQFEYVQRQSIRINCERCERSVRLIPPKTLCATCVSALECGAPASMDEYGYGETRMRNPHGRFKTPAFFLLSALSTSESWAGSTDTTARALVADWKDADTRMAAVAEVIASAFASGLSWCSHLGGTEVYCPPPDLGGREIMSALERFLEVNPDMAEKAYGAAIAASLRYAFPCNSDETGNSFKVAGQGQTLE
jgi:hypothetical protein